MQAKIVIFLLIFIDLIGFGIVLPMLPVYSKVFGASGLMIGIIVASFAIMQVIFSPIWGRLSDRIGRRPVILISMAASTLSYALFTFGSLQTHGTWALFLILISRIFAGSCGGNTNVAQAYIADITPPKTRSATLGLVSLAFSLGLICGPAIGAFCSKWGIHYPPLAATGISFFSFVLAFFILKEPKHVANYCGSKNFQETHSRMKVLKEALTHKKIGPLCGLHFISTFCFSCSEVTLGLLAVHNLSYGLSQVGLIFTYHGVITALTQIFVNKKIIDNLGEARVICLSFFCCSASLLLLPWCDNSFTFIASMTLNSFAVAINRPSTFGLISYFTPPNIQGEVLGISQSIGSIARCISPLTTSSLFAVAVYCPYLVCGILALTTAILMINFVRITPKVQILTLNQNLGNLNYE